MRASRFTEQQIVAALRQAEDGTPVVEVCRTLGITEQTCYRWKRKFADMGVAELRRLRQVEEEHRRLKQLVADLTLDNQMLHEALRKKRVKPAQKRAVVLFFRVGCRVSDRRACQVAGVGRSRCRSQSQARDQTPLRQRRRELAAVRVRYGYRRLHVLLRRDRAECLDQQWCETLAEAKEVIEAWRIDYNEERPHRSLQQQVLAVVLTAWQPLEKAAD